MLPALLLAIQLTHGAVSVSASAGVATLREPLLPVGGALQLQVGYSGGSRFWPELGFSHSRWAEKTGLQSWEFSTTLGVRYYLLDGPVRPSVSAHAGYRRVESGRPEALAIHWDLLPLQAGARLEWQFDSRASVLVEATATHHLNYGGPWGAAFLTAGFRGEF